MSHSHARDESKPVRLSAEDNARLRQLYSAMEERAQRMRAIVARNLGQPLGDGVIEFSVQRARPPAGAEEEKREARIMFFGEPDARQCGGWDMREGVCYSCLSETDDWKAQSLALWPP